MPNLSQIATVLAIAGTLVGGIYFMEDRYQKQVAAQCSLERSNTYVEQSVNSLRLELSTNNLMKETDPVKQATILSDIKLLQERQKSLSTKLNTQC